MIMPNKSYSINQVSFTLFDIDIKHDSNNYTNLKDLNDFEVLEVVYKLSAMGYTEIEEDFIVHNDFE